MYNIVSKFEEFFFLYFQDLFLFTFKIYFWKCKCNTLITCDHTRFGELFPDVEPGVSLKSDYALGKICACWGRSLHLIALDNIVGFIVAS